MLEQFVPFAIIVLVGAVTHVSTPVTVAYSITFFWLRVAHAIGMISGFARLPLRPHDLRCRVDSHVGVCLASAVQRSLDNDEICASNPQPE
jgi:hypothetical protein